MIKRRFVQGLLILALLCGAVLLAHPSAAWALDGTGSKDDPYQISTAADLKEFAEKVNGGDTAACAVLTTDIDLNGSTSEQWTPIGDGSNPYTGTFDGAGNKIKGLYINSDAGYAGLFGYIGTNGTVKNLTLSNSYIRISRSDSTAYVGGICGYNNGSIQNCCNSVKATATVTGSSICVGGICGENWGSIENCSNSGPVEGSGSIATVGGICGVNDGGRITSCSNSCDVTGSGSVGGICGYNDGGRITNCSNSGSVEGSGSIATVGGICGENDGTVTNCSNSGPVTGSGEVGGICGENSYDPLYNYGGSITNCYWLDSTAEKGVGVNEAGATVTEVLSKTAEQYASGEVAWLLNQWSGDSVLNGKVWAMGEDGYPVLNGKNDNIVVKLTFDANTGNVEDQPIIRYANAGAALPNVSLPEITGYSFTGWYEDVDCNGEQVTKIPDNATGEKTYYAKWTANTYTVTLNTNNGTIADGKEVTSYTYGTATMLPTEQDITHTGLNFGGWYDNAAFSGAPVTGITTTDFGDKTYYAKWTAEVTLNTNGGTVNSGNITDYTYGTETTLPTDVTRAG